MPRGPYRIGDYRIELELASDGHEIRYRAVHVMLPRTAIVRVAPQAHAAQLMREVYLVEALRHPGVPRVFECGTLPGPSAWVATELVEGTPLARLLEAGPLTVSEVLAMLRNVAEILDQAHRHGVTHGGVCSEAIVYRDGVRGYPLCLVGWRTARLETAPTADIRDLGIAAFEALTGTAPALPLACCPAAVPEPLGALLMQMLAGDPAVRPSAEVVAREAARLAARPMTAMAGAAARPESPTRPLPPWRALPPLPPRSRPRWTPAFPTESPSPSAIAAVATACKRDD